MTIQEASIFTAGQVRGFGVELESSIPDKAVMSFFGIPTSSYDSVRRVLNEEAATETAAKSRQYMACFSWEDYRGGVDLQGAASVRLDERSARILEAEIDRYDNSANILVGALER